MLDDYTKTDVLDEEEMIPEGTPVLLLEAAAKTEMPTGGEAGRGDCTSQSKEKDEWYDTASLNRHGQVDGRAKHLRESAAAGKSGRPPLPDLQYASPSDPSKMSRFNEADLPKHYQYKSEKFEHRIIGYLKAQGYSNKEVAEQTGYSAQAVSIICRLPWVKDLIHEEIARSGREAVQEVLSATGLDSIHFLIETRDDTKVKTSDRISANRDLMNRIWGLPNQPITHQQKVDLNSLSDEALAQLALKHVASN